MSASTESRAGAPRAPANAGFTLFETLVAFCVLASLMGVLYRGVVELRLGADAADARGRAALVAQSILEESIAARTLRDGTTRGRRDGIAWRREAKPVDLAAQLAPPPAPQPGQPAPPPTTPQWRMQRVKIVVETGRAPLVLEAIHLVRAS